MNWAMGGGQEEQGRRTKKGDQERERGKQTKRGPRAKGVKKTKRVHDQNGRVIHRNEKLGEGKLMGWRSLG